MSARIAVAALGLAAVASLAVVLLRDDPGSAPDADFAYYTLALSWSPTYCETEDREQRTAQCRGRPRAFVLHGFWPQHERGWPASCYSGKRAWVPEAVIDDMMPIMPGRGLIIHQYAKHGSCSGLTPEAYFAAASRAYQSVRVPERFLKLERTLYATPAEIERAFLQSNPQLGAEMIAITCGPERLREVRVCFSKALEPRQCGANEDQARLCDASRVRVPPKR